jgi:magnesium transporter
MVEEILDRFHLLDIQNELHPSDFTLKNDYDVFILRLPYFYKGELLVTSYAYVITKEAYFYYDKSLKHFLKLQTLEELYSSLDEKVNLAMQATLDIFNQIEVMEDSFYERKAIKDFNHTWFMHKNRLIRINRVLNKANEEMKKFIQAYKESEDFLEVHFDDLSEHLERTNRNALHALEKLDALYNFYVSVHQDKMNSTIYILTFLSAIFLPLNLIVGFFGMNTNALPFAKEEYGSYFVFVLLVLVVIALLIGIKLLKKFNIIFRL